MVASVDTVLKIYEAFIKVGITDKQLDRLIMLLSEIPGNQSFRDTVSRLEWYHKSFRNKERG